MRYSLILLLSCVPFLSLIGGCAVEDCEPEADTYCDEGVSYWVDSCGDIGLKKEDCLYGCLALLDDHSDCDPWECRTSNECMDLYGGDWFCDLTVHICKKETCAPQCTGWCCGADGCGGTCPDDCPVGWDCNMSTCQCEDLSGCTTHDDCGPNDICVNAGCEAAYGREFWFTVETADVSQYDQNGAAWDVGGGMPDPRICFYLNQSSVPISPTGAEFCTSTVDDTFTATYNEEFRDSIFASDAWLVVAFDEDLTDWEYIEHYEFDPISMDLLKGGGFVFEGDYLTQLVVTIDPVE